MGIHGGDIYRNLVQFDFSVNVNPLGIPEEVKEAMRKALEWCSRYPDSSAEKLKQAVSEMLGIPKEYLLFGNGSSELFMAVVHGIRPQKTVIPVPSFYGYEYAAKAYGGEIIYCETKAKEIGREGDLLFFANPNNPTGKLMEKEEVREILTRCREKGTFVVLDECFIEFCGGECSMISEIEQFENLILIRAFTKIFSIPGVRLGYLVCSSREVLEKVKRQLPEWNLSCFAQEAGCVCARQKAFLLSTVDYVKKEREFLEEGLRQLGVLAFPSRANFILIYSEKPLYERLLKRGILIRDCENFRGLRRGFYRIAVKTRRENEILLNVMGEELWEK